MKTRQRDTVAKVCKQCRLHFRDIYEYRRHLEKPPHTKQERKK